MVSPRSDDMAQASIWPEPDRSRRMRRLVAGTVLYALAMAFVESAVVVYLRALTHGGPFVDTASAVLPPSILGVEIAREASTLIMLAAVGWLAGRDRWERTALFWLAFAIWDLAYYGWLWVLIGWPPSLLAWDVLFLIPVPWTAPVLAPVLVSLGLAAGAAMVLRGLARGVRPAFRRWNCAAIIVGGVLIFSTFVVDFRTAIHGRAPDRYHWGFFALGFVLAALGGAAATVSPDRSA
jgi:hypothetical protein